MKILFMYHEDEPKRGSVQKGSLPRPAAAFKKVRPLFLTQRSYHDRLQLSSVKEKIQTLELRNQDVQLPQSEGSLHWCRIFKLGDITQKHHIIKFEPVFESTASISFINQIILYECPDTENDWESLSRESGRSCHTNKIRNLKCNIIVAVWARGSEVN